MEGLGRRGRAQDNGFEAERLLHELHHACLLTSGNKNEMGIELQNVKESKSALKTASQTAQCCGDLAKFSLIISRQCPKKTCPPYPSCGAEGKL